MHLLAITVSNKGSFETRELARQALKSHLKKECKWS
jgi:hypothetical protein